MIIFTIILLIYVEQLNVVAIKLSVAIRHSEFAFVFFGILLGGTPNIIRDLISFGIQSFITCTMNRVYEAS